MVNYQISSSKDMVTNHDYIFISISSGGYVQVKLDDEGVVVDLLQNKEGDEEYISSTYASYQELAGK